MGWERRSVSASSGYLKKLWPENYDKGYLGEVSRPSGEVGCSIGTVFRWVEDRIVFWSVECCRIRHMRQDIGDSSGEPKTFRSEHTIALWQILQCHLYRNFHLEPYEHEMTENDRPTTQIPWYMVCTRIVG